MKKRFLLLLCALLALPVFASAEDVLTLSGAALNAAQTIAADDSLIITETITDGEGTSVTVLSHRLNDLRQEVFTLLDEDGTLTQLRPDYGFRLAPDSANPETFVMMPDVLAETRESLRGQLALFDDEETYLFVRQPDGTLTAVTSYALDGETLAETYRISAETHTLIYYAAEAADADGVLETYTVSVLRDGIDSFDELFPNAGEGETFSLRLVSIDGTETTLSIPLNLAVVFSDGVEDNVMFEDAALTVPVSRFEPWTHDSGFTLYEGTEE